MRKIFLFIIFYFSIHCSFGQYPPKEYFNLIKLADSLYKAGEYQKAAFSFSNAFRTNGGKGDQESRYKAACAYAQSGNPDSAFSNLEPIVTKLKFSEYERVAFDPCFQSIYEDDRWPKLLSMIQKNKANYNEQLARQLEAILDEDQKYRIMLDSLNKVSSGRQSSEYQNMVKNIKKADSINLINVKAILDEHGFLGDDVVGRKGTAALFLVIQHADLATREYYLPMMREASKQNKIHPRNLALIEDRTALDQGKKQIYGTQLGEDSTGRLNVLPLEDPDNVDKRRKAAGMPPLSEYLKHFGLEWDLELYKKQQKID